MDKYSTLKNHLEAQRTEAVPMRFGDIEKVIGSKLPLSAGKYRVWWANSRASKNPAVHVWMDAGYKTEKVSMSKATLVFRKVDTPNKHTPNMDAHPITRLYGALKECITIAKDIDLTNPALQSLDENFDKKWDAKLSETNKGEGQ